MIETHFFSSIFLPAVLALIILGMGLSLTAEDFRNIVQNPRSVITGLICQMLLLPSLAFLITWFAGSWMSPEMKVGLVLVAACPGGATAGLLSHLLKGNVALSVSITTVNSFLTIFTIPAITNFAMSTYMGTSKTLVMPFMETLIHIVIITVIPCIIGVFIRARWPRVAISVEKPLKPFMAVSLAVAILAAMFLEKKDGPALDLSNFPDVLPWALLLNVAGMFTGWGAGALIRLGDKSMLTLGLEAGLHNTGLAIAVATSRYMLDDSNLAVPAATYAMFSIFTALAFGLFVNRKNVKLKQVFKQ